MLFRACKWLFLACLLVVFVLGGAVLWLQSGTKQVSALSAVLISKLQADDAPYELEVGSVELDWSGWREFASIRLAGIHLKSAEYDTVVDIPSGVVSLDFTSLLAGKLEVASLALSGVDVNLLREGDDWLLLGSQGELVYNISAGGDTGRMAIFPVEELLVNDSSLTISDTRGADAVSLSAINLSLVKNSESELEITYGANGAISESTFTVVGSSVVDVAAGLAKIHLQPQGISPSWLCGGWVDCSQLPTLKMPLSGAVTILLEEYKPTQLHLALKGEKGDLSFVPHLSETLNIDAMKLDGVVNITEKGAKLEAIKIQFDSGTVINASGELKMADEGFFLDAKADAVDVHVNDLYKYWPEGLAPQTREWATARIRGGMASKADVVVKITPEDLIPENLPDSFLSARVHLKESSVNYIDNFPKAKNVNALVRFTGAGMAAEVSSAKVMKNTNVLSSKVVFTDFNAPGTPVKIDINLASSPQDAYELMKSLPAHPLKRHGVDVSAAKGSVSADVSLAFDAFSGKAKGENINWDGLKYSVKANAKNVDGVLIKNSIPLDGINGSVIANSKKYDIKLNGDFQGSAYQFTYDATVGKSEVLGLNGVLPAGLLQAAIPASKDYINGVANADITLTRKGDVWAPSAVVDLTQAQVNLALMEYNKPVGEAAKLIINAQLDAPERMSWAYDSSKLQTNGLLQINWDNASVDALEVTRYLSDNQDFALRYQSMNGGGFRADVSGRKLDLTPIWQPKAERQATISDMPPIQLRLDLNEVMFPSGGSMRGVKGHLFCNSDRCRSADVSANLPKDGRFKLFVGPKDGNRIFSFNATQLGELAMLLDIHDDLHGGVAEIEGVYDDSRAGNPLDGRAHVTDFVIKDAPIMTRILNAASLTGALDSLRGDGIRFDKFAADFVFAEDLLSLKNGKAAGDSIGVLIDGDINIATNILDVGGNLAPAHAINSLLGKIPLIGELLAGGKGESIIAIDFGVEGPLDDPSVTVNPLSALTPGFTRKFFDIFDSPPDTSAPAN